MSLRRTLAFHLSIEFYLFLDTFYFLFFLSHLPACVPEETCRLNDLAEDQHFEQQAMLGTWHMLARATPDVTTLYREFGDTAPPPGPLETFALMAELAR